MTATPILAAERVSSLVSGLPRDSRRLRWFLMLQAFVDASGKGDPNVLVVAGYVARADEWAKFSQAWKEKLDQKGLRRFKMTEMQHQMEFVAYFYRTIEEFDIPAAISCVFDTAALMRMVDEFVPHSSALDLRALKNPYLYAARQIIENLALEQQKMGLQGPVDFIFDDEAEKARLSPHWDWFRASLSPEVRKLVGSDPIYRNDEDFMPLQAADLWAWWVRKWYEDRNANGVKYLNFPWTVKRIIPRIHSVYDEAFLRSTLLKFMQTPIPPDMTVNREPRTQPKRNEVKLTLPDPSSPLTWRR